MLFPTADALTINTKWNSIQPVRQLQYIVYLFNFIIVQQIVNSYDSKL